MISRIALVGLLLPATLFAQDDLKSRYDAAVRPLLKKFCLDCHSTEEKEGSLDLERFTSVELVRKEVKPWLQTIEMLEAGEMPPKNNPQPTAAERRQLIAWIREFLDAEARARAGDPGFVPLRRLSNAEYDHIIRDLTGVDLKPTREFPADGAAGEGFTNAAEGLSEISPALLTKYLNAAKELADHVVLLPDGFRFSPAKTRRDWTDESTLALREFFKARAAGDGRLLLQPYLAVAVRHRDALLGGKLTPEEAATREKVNPRYFALLWKTLNDKTPSPPLDAFRARWRAASENDVPALVADLEQAQKAYWKFVPIGSYRHGDSPRQQANDPAAAEQVTVRGSVKPAAGAAEATFYLVTSEPVATTEKVVWSRPRLEGKDKPPLLLRDYAKFGPAFEIEPTTVFAAAAKYLAAVADAAHNPKLKAAPEELAQERGLDASLLKRWIEVTAVEVASAVPADADPFAQATAAGPLELLSEQTPKNDQAPWIKGWRNKAGDLPVVVANSGDETVKIPGTVPGHRVAVHPLPQEFVAVVWKSPLAGKVTVTSQITHAHPSCGNAVAFRLEHRRGERALTLAEGAVDFGGTVKPPAKAVEVAKGDLLLLIVDAKNGDHVCDLTEIGWTIASADQKWDLAADIADSILDGNPHADKFGGKDTWSFVKGPAKAGATKSAPFPIDSLLGRWRAVAADRAKRAEADVLAAEIQQLLTGSAPDEKSPNRAVYNDFLNVNGKLLNGLDLSRFARPRTDGKTFGLPTDRFQDADLIVAANSTTEIRLPAALVRDRELVVEGRVVGPLGDRLVKFEVLTSPPTGERRWDGKTPVVAAANSAAYRELIAGHTAFRDVFPYFVCFPNVVPTDEVVSLKMFHREDEPLKRLLLTAEETKQLDRLWERHRFISRQAIAENDYLPQFIGYVTQDQPKELLAYFEGLRPLFQQRADAQVREQEAAIPAQLSQLLDFTARAFRRPLSGKEREELQALYQSIRARGAEHEEAFRGVLTRVFVSPAFLFHIEHAPPGANPAPVNDHELAFRLSSFLWASAPDDELRSLAAAGKLRDPEVLVAQSKRMLQDPRVRALAIEFGTQWLHVRNFDEHHEKNEKLFPTFNAALRAAIYEESILFFQDLFQQNRSIQQLLDADYTYLNDELAKHYGIPNVGGQEFRRVDGVKQFGRGGVLGLASVQATQSGASRTSPVLRGNWVVETLLGEKLPRPPANVPQLPEESGVDGLTTRQLTEKHTTVQECAVCHVRIDPLGFALEHYDPIGRRRNEEAPGRPVDAKAKLRDGAEFEGLDGLRSYLLTKKRAVITRLFCRRLLGYALGRATALSDESLLNEMTAALDKNDGRVEVAVLAIVQSPQFRMIRGGDYTE